MPYIPPPRVRSQPNGPNRAGSSVTAPRVNGSIGSPSYGTSPVISAFSKLTLPPPSQAIGNDENSQPTGPTIESTESNLGNGNTITNQLQTQTQTQTQTLNTNSAPQNDTDFYHSIPITTDLPLHLPPPRSSTYQFEPTPTYTQQNRHITVDPAPPGESYSHSHSRNHSISSVDTEEREEFMRFTPTLVRKKSGELVKSSLKYSASMPTTPTYAKAVHFDSNHLVDVRRFYDFEKPAAVSAGSSPVLESDPRLQLGDPEMLSLDMLTDEFSDNSDSDLESSSDSDSNSDSDSESDSDSPLSTPIRTRRHHKHRSRSAPRFKLLCEALPTQKPPAPVFLDKLYLSADTKTIIGHVAVQNLAFQKWVVVRYTLDGWKTITERPASYNSDNPRKLKMKGYDRFTFNIEVKDLPSPSQRIRTIQLCIRYSIHNREMWDNNNRKNYTAVLSRVKQPHKHHQREDKEEKLGRLSLSSSTSSLSGDLPGGYDAGIEGNFARRSPWQPSAPAGSAVDGILGERPALDSSRYKDLLDSYCFYRGSPKLDDTELLGSPSLSAGDFYLSQAKLK